MKSWRILIYNLWRFHSIWCCTSCRQCDNKCLWRGQFGLIVSFITILEHTRIGGFLHQTTTFIYFAKTVLMPGFGAELYSFTGIKQVTSTQCIIFMVIVWINFWNLRFGLKSRHLLSQCPPPAVLENFSKNRLSVS